MPIFREENLPVSVCARLFSIDREKPLREYARGGGASAGGGKWSPCLSARAPGSGRLSYLATLHPWTSIARRYGAKRLSLSPARMRNLSRVANPARSGTVLASLPESSFVFVATRAGLSEGGNDALKHRRHGDVRPRFNGVPPVRRVPRWKIDGGERLTAEVRVGRVRGVSCELTPMVFENIEMRNPAGFLLEDARHGYIQYIRYLPSHFTPQIS